MIEVRSAQDNLICYSDLKVSKQRRERGSTHPVSKVKKKNENEEELELQYRE
jgi:hypothetical protein